MITKTQVPRPEKPAALTFANGRGLSLDRPLVMGVLNVTPDSFSDGGAFDTPAVAIEHALSMIDEGADIIDIGGESSRPGAEPVEPDLEQIRVLPVIDGLRSQTDMPISIDTYHASTAAKALDAGADIVNDISALRFDSAMARLVSGHGATVVLMHMQGTPKNMQANPQYHHCVEEIAAFFEERLSFCDKQGIDRTRLILDPGLGFGKRLEDNLDILAGIGEFKKIGQPILVGASRKNFISKVHNSGSAARERVGGSIAAAVVVVMNGASIVRSHDVAPTVEAIRVAMAIEQAG